MNMDPFAKSPSDPFKSKDNLNPSFSKEIFAKERSGGGTGRPYRKPEDAEQLESPSADPIAEPEKKTPKVLLRNPKWEADKVGFNEETDISVELELPDEFAHKTKVAFELFAKTPKGPQRISQGEGHAELGKAKCTIPVYIPDYKDADGNRMQKVEYYFIAKHSESAPLNGEKSPKLVDEMADRLIESHILQDITFGSNKSVLRPSSTAALKVLCSQIKSWRAKTPDGKLAIFGHADAVGKEEPNKALSERRAKSVYAFLMKDARSWEELGKEEKWGLAPIQDLLKHLGHDPGASDGQDGPKTQEAVKSFQTQKNLTVNGNADEKTREALFQAFMDDCNELELKKKEFDDVNGSPTAGCSEFNLAEKTQGASKANRRVSVLLLKANKNFPIRYPCAKGDVGACKSQVGRKGERRTAGFGCLFYDHLVTEEKAKTEPVNIGPLKFLEITEQEIKQYVNLPTGKKFQGMERLIEVEAEGAVDGVQVFWKITAGEKNSKRTEPKIGVKPLANDKAKEFVSGMVETETEFTGSKASIVLCCGAAGGDTFTVEAGLSKEKMDIKVLVCTWRKLNYEIMAPDFMAFEERETADGAAVMDFPSGMLSRIKERLGKAYVEYELFKSHAFSEADAPEGAVFKSEQIGLPAGGKGYVLTDHTFKSYPKKFDKGMAPRSIGLKLCNRNYFFESANSLLTSYTLPFTSSTLLVEPFKRNQVFFLPKSAENGLDSVKSLTWKALVDPIAHPKHPGVANGRAREGVLSSTSIKLITTKAFEIELPSLDPMDPGKLVGPNLTAERCPIEVKIKFEGAEEGLGLAGQGAQEGENLVVYNPDSPDSFVDVLLHELGHSMGQTIYSGTYLPPKGYTVPKKSSEDDADYAHNGTKGHVYVGKGHSGPHCAYGLSDLDKALASYSGKPGTCIMFGENSGQGDSLATTGYCPQCEDNIKHRDIHDLSDLLE